MINRRLAGLLGICTAFVILLLGTVSAYKPVSDYSTLLQYLRDSGALVADTGEPGWSPCSDDYQGRRVTVNGSDIDVYEYASPEAMEAEATRISPSGTGFECEESGNLTKAFFVDWIAPPHFYKAGRVIVFYIGKDDSIISLLRNGLGREFAGW